MRVALLFLSMALSGCAAQRAIEAHEAKTRLVGMTDEKILSCMGAPHGRSGLGATEVWQYGSGNGQTNVYGSANAWGDGVVTGNVSANTRYCVINIAMKDHVVQTVNYSGPTGGALTEGEQCAFAVKACLPE